MNQTESGTGSVTRSVQRKIVWLYAVVMAAGACSNAAKMQARNDGAALVDRVSTTSDTSAGADATTTTDSNGASDAAIARDIAVSMDVAAPMDAAAAIDIAAPGDAGTTADIAVPGDAASPIDGARIDAVGDRTVIADAAIPDVSTTTKQTLFYLDVQGRVMSVDPQTRTAHTVVASAGQGPDGIAIDQAHGFIYWTTMGVPAANDGTVMRARLDGTGATTIIAKGDTYTPKQMKIDLASNKLYWSDREGMRVMRANVDGTQLETLVTVATGDTARADQSNFCVGVAVDTAGGWLYWTQKGPTVGHVGSIRRAHIAMPAGQTSATRTDIEILWSGLPEPIDMDVDVEAGLIYWTDRGDGTVNRSPIAIPAGATAATRTDRQVLVTKVEQAIGVVLDRPHGVLYYTSATGQVGRAGLDGAGAVDLLTKAGALTGIVVADGI
jgi:hypothetical protein